MPETEINHLSIRGYGGRALANRFFRQAAAPTGLAVLYPGLSYTCDMPLLYFPTQLCLQRGMDVLQLQTDYGAPDFRSAPAVEQTAWMAADAEAALQAGRGFRSYPLTVLAGKSIGTLALAHMLAPNSPVKESLGRFAVIWLTPLLHQPTLVAAALQSKEPSLFVVGTGDRTFVPEALERIKAATPAQALVLEGANHSLEIPGDILRSLQVLQGVFQNIDQFLASVLPDRR